MNVKSKYAIAIATLSDWFKNLVPVYQPEGKPKLIMACIHSFSHAFSKLHGIASLCFLHLRECSNTRSKK